MTSRVTVDKKKIYDPLLYSQQRLWWQYKSATRGCWQCCALYNCNWTVSVNVFCLFLQVMLRDNHIARIYWCVVQCATQHQAYTFYEKKYALYIDKTYLKRCRVYFFDPETCSFIITPFAEFFLLFLNKFNIDKKRYTQAYTGRLDMLQEGRNKMSMTNTFLEWWMVQNKSNKKGKLEQIE